MTQGTIRQLAQKALSFARIAGDRIWSAAKRMGFYALIFWGGCFYGSIVPANAGQAEAVLRGML